MLGLVCVALLYTILVTRAPRRDLGSCTVKGMPWYKVEEAWERNSEDTSVFYQHVNHFTDLTVKVNFLGAVDSLFCL